jgi:hypothetical protein
VTEKNELIIRSEDQALEILNLLNNGVGFDPAIKVTFEGWPKLTIRLIGEDFDRSVPTRIMPAILELQKQVYRLYCRTRYGDENLRKLTKEDRDKLELVVKVDKGSSIFETLLSEPLVKIFQDATSKMTPEQLTMTLIGFGLMLTGGWGWKVYNNRKSQEHALNHQVELSKIELQKQQIIAESIVAALHQGNPLIREIRDENDAFKSDLLSRLKPTDQLQIASENTNPLTISGAQGALLNPRERKQASERFIDGSYSIANIGLEDLDNTDLEIRDSQGNLIRVIIHDGALNHSQMEILKNDGFGRRPIHMRLLVKESGGRITKAQLISINEDDIG